MRLQLNSSKIGDIPIHKILFSGSDIINWTSYYHGHRDICICYYVDDKIFNFINNIGKINDSHGEISYILSEKDESKNHYLRSNSATSFYFTLNTESEEEAKKIFAKLKMLKK